MIVKKMTAHFGALDGQTLELAPGLNVVYAPNESGKSTWCAFLRAMLYGISTSERARQGQRPDKVKYRPWSGAPMSGSLELDTPDGPVTIRRWTERANQPMQAFAATVTGTDTPAAGLTGDNAGYRLTGVPREVFERSAFIRQSGLGVTGDPELEKRLAAIVSAGDEEQSYQETDKRLRTWLRRRRNGRRGAIPELEEDMARTEEELDRLTDAARDGERLDEELAAAQERYARAVKRMEQARQAQRKAAWADMTGAREALAAKEDEYRRAEAERDRVREARDRTPFGDMGPEEARRRSDIDMKNARELTRLAAKLPPVWIAFIPLGLGVLAFLLALALPWTAELVTAGGVGVLLFVVMYLRLLSIRRTKEDTLADRRRILDAYGAEEPEDIEAMLDQYRALWEDSRRADWRLEEAAKALEEARRAHEEAEERARSGFDVVSGDTEAARAGDDAAQARAEVDRLKESRAQAQGRSNMMGDPLVLRSDLAEQSRRRSELLAQEAALELAIQTMEEADRQLQERFSPRLARLAAEIFSELTDGRYDEITLARDLTAKARLAGDAVGWETDYLSEGARDQLYLALRLAMCRLVLPEEQGCPIVLDDALVTFDQARMERALELLKTIAERRQVILFTCHEREYAHFASDPAVHRLRLGE